MRFILSNKQRIVRAKCRVAFILYCSELPHGTRRVKTRKTTTRITSELLQILFRTSNYFTILAHVHISAQL